MRTIDHETSPFRPGLLAGQVALVTGGGTGIGRAIADQYAALGARVALCGRRLEPVTEAAEAIRARGGESFAASVDIRSPEAIEGFVTQITERWGTVDVLVNNAGGQFPSPAQHISPKGFEAVVRNNLLGTFNVTHAVANAVMIPQRRGAVINIIANIFRGFPGMAHTGAARAGVENLTRTLAVEWATYHIRVNAIAPGTIRSTGTDRYPPELLDKAERETPAGRLGTVHEVAHAAAFLASDAADYVTGATLYIDGGASLYGDIWVLPGSERVTVASLVEAPPYDKVALLRDGKMAFPAMLEAISTARVEVLIEMYWFDDTPIARRFIDALAELARAGVKVRVSYDAIGSIGSDDARFAPLLAAGGQVIEYNPIAPWRRRFRFGWVSQRDHRKIVVVDGRVGFIGGLNIGTPWVSVEDGGRGWRDDVARVEGVGATRLRALFYDVWCRQGGDRPTDIMETRGWKRVVVARKESGLVAAADPSAVAVLGHDAWGARWIIRRVYLQRIRASARRVLIANSYFIPDLAVCRALERAARRGVEVRVIVPRVSDVPPVAWATQHLYTRLMKAGVHVHEYLGRVMHAKTALVDEWATTGSYNLDSLSWRTNLEANMATSDPGFVRAVAASFELDLAACEEVDPVRWSRRPWADKLRSWAWYLFRKFL